MDSLECETVDNPNVSVANRANRTNNTPQLVEITQIALFATAEIGCRSTTLVVITLKSADVFHQIHINGQHVNTQTHINGQHAHTQIHMNGQHANTQKHTYT